MLGAGDTQFLHHRPDIEQCLAHYKALQKGTRAPTLAEFLDNAPYPLMPQIAVAEMWGPGEFTMRFFGTRLVELCGMDLTGRRAWEARGVTSCKAPLISRSALSKRRLAPDFGGPGACLQQPWPNGARSPLHAPIRLHCFRL
jgi:hypothetical protein